MLCVFTFHYISIIKTHLNDQTKDDRDTVTGSNHPMSVPDQQRKDNYGEVTKKFTQSRLRFLSFGLTVKPYGTEHGFSHK